MTRIITLLTFLLPITLSAQFFEVGLMGGGSNYSGDLTPESRITQLGDTRFAYGAFGRYNINEYLAAKFSVAKGTITGNDAASDRARNLSFETDILDIALTAELNIFGFRPIDLGDVISPYLFAGINFYKFDPFAIYNGQEVPLQPLGTEGQGLPDQPEKYKLGQFAIPMGIGLKYAINDKINVGLELGARMTFTDHLDDVSGAYVDPDELTAVNGATAAALANRTGSPIVVGTNRGNPEEKDWYFLGVVTVSYNFMDSGLAGFRKKSRSRSGCPTF